MSGLRLWFRFIAVSIKSQAQYPTSAILLTIGQFLTTMIEIVAVWALFDRFGSVRGWTFAEVAVFYGLVHVMFAVSGLLTRGVEELGNEFLRTGAFDRLLLRPRTVMLQLMGHDFRLSRLGRMAQGLLVMCIGAQVAGIEWSLGDVLMMLWAVAGGVALFTGVVVLQGAVSFWTIESLEIANVLTYGGVQAAQYPLSLYNDWLRGLLTFVVPLACVAYYPILTLLDRPDPLGAPAWFGYVAPLAGFVFLALSFVGWRFGVRQYGSVGS
jgi:ABC-2 type transport system permease protein